MPQKTPPSYDANSPLWWGIDPDGRPNQEKLNELIKRAVTAVQPKQIILFGSASRREMNEQSDLDLLVIKDGLDPRTTARLRALAKIN